MKKYITRTIKIKEIDCKVYNKETGDVVIDSIYNGVDFSDNPEKLDKELGKYYKENFKSLVFLAVDNVITVESKYRMSEIDFMMSAEQVK